VKDDEVSSDSPGVDAGQVDPRHGPQAADLRDLHRSEWSVMANDNVTVVLHPGVPSDFKRFIDDLPDLTVVAPPSVGDVITAIRRQECCLVLSGWNDGFIQQHCAGYRSRALATSNTLDTIRTMTSCSRTRAASIAP